MHRVWTLGLLLLGAAPIALIPASPAGAAPAAVPGEVIVRFEQGAGPAERAAVRERSRVDFERGLGLAGVQLVEAEPGQSAAQAIDELERSGRVAYAEPNFYRRAQAVLPDDSHFDLQWALENRGQPILGSGGVADADIDAPEAWGLSTGSPAVTVAVIDSGVDAFHPDLAPNMWSNGGESGGGRESNGVDDDRNGYVDDAAGWDWVADDGSPYDENDHGTHVAGTAGARGGDGIGVAGVGWQNRLMALRVLDANGGGRVSDAILAYRYAVARGAQVVNLSLGGADLSMAERDAIAAAPGTMFVAAAGNSGADVDRVPEYPCAHPLPNVVCVAASDQRDALPAFSNYGATAVDLAAPGDRIASTLPGGGWGYASGTSMAAPHVAGAAALVWAQRPFATVAQVKAALLAGGDRKPAFLETTVSGGRLNLEGALRAAGVVPEPGPPPSPDPPADPGPGPGPEPGPADQADPGPPAAPRPPVAAPRELATPEAGAPGRRRASPPSLVAARGQRLGGVLRHGLAVRARCSEPCRMRIRVLVDARTARRLGLPRRTVTLGRRTVSLASGARRLTLGLSARSRLGLTRVRAVRIVLSVRATDAGGGVHTMRSRIVLRR